MNDNTRTISGDPLSLPAFRFLFLVFCFFMSAYLLTLKGYPLFVDEELMMETTINMVENADFNTIHHPWTTKPGRNGLYYSNYGIGQSVFEVPFYLAAKILIPEDIAGRKELLQTVVSTSAPVIASLLAVMMILCASALGCSRKLSWRIALLTGFCTMVWPYSKMLFRDPLQTLLLFTTVTLLILDRKSDSLHNDPHPFVLRHASWFAGAVFGFAVTVKETMALFLPVLICYLVWKRPGPLFRKLASFTIPVIAGGIVCLCYNYFRFGNPFDFGYTETTLRLGLTTPLLEGLFGLFFSSGRSFFLFNPILLLVIPAFPLFFRRYPLEAILIACIFSINSLFTAKYWTWGGSWAWGPRFLLILVPLTALPIGMVWDRITDTPWKKRGVLGLIMISVLVQIPGVTMHIAPYLSMIAYDVHLFPMTYEVGSEIRNDLIHVDFIPQFSPLWGLSWSLKHALTMPFRDRLQIRESMKQDCPWGTISARWIPENPDKALGIGPDLLGFIWKQSRPGLFRLLVFFYLIDMVICIVCYYRIRKFL